MKYEFAVFCADMSEVPEFFETEIEALTHAQNHVAKWPGESAVVFKFSKMLTSAEPVAENTVEPFASKKYTKKEIEEIELKNRATL